MAKVAPDNSDELFATIPGLPQQGGKFLKPMPHTTLDELDAAFVARCKALGEQHFELKDGRSICYFQDGDDGVPILAFHGGCECKWRFVMKERIPGVTLVGIDRPHYGKSSPIKAGPKDHYTFEMAADDISQLADHLGYDQFIVMGHSVGTSWCQQLAAALPSRVRGCILFGSMGDPYDPKATAAVRKALGCPTGVLDPQKGCMKSVVLGAMGGFAKGGVPKIAKYGLGLEKKGADYFAKFTADTFWMSTMAASWGGFTDKDAIIGDVYRTLAGKWFYPTSNINCPVLLFHGKEDKDLKVPVVPDYLKELIPQIQIELIPSCGHIAVVGPTEETKERILMAVAAMPPLTGNAVLATA